MKDFKPQIFKDKEKEITVFKGLCKGCGMCLEKCPKKAIVFSKKEVGYYSTPTVEIDLKKCIICNICELICPDSAIRVDKIKK